MENESEGNENKIILGDCNCTTDKIDGEGVDKIHRLYRCDSNHVVSKFIVDNVLEDLWRRKNPGFSEFTHYDRSSGTRSKIDRFYNDIKIAHNTKINYIMVSFTDHYAISINRLP